MRLMFGLTKIFATSLKFLFSYHKTLKHSRQNDRSLINKYSMIAFNMTSHLHRIPNNARNQLSYLERQLTFVHNLAVLIMENISINKG